VTKIEAITLIDAHKNALINPVEMLDWTWLRVIIDNIDDMEWAHAVQDATETLSK
jgi:hypothetical protein